MFLMYAASTNTSEIMMTAEAVEELCAVVKFVQTCFLPWTPGSI